MAEKNFKIHSVKYNFLMNVILKTSTFIFPLVTFPYVSRVLGPGPNGDISFAASVISYFSLVAAMGIPSYGDQGNLNTMANKLVNDHAKVIVGITTPACQALANATKDIPIVMGGIGDPVGAGLVKNEKHPEGNVTGVHDVNPSEQQIALVKKFIPNIKTLGVIYTSSDTSSESQYRTMVKAAHKLHVNLKTYTIANANELNQTSQTMLSKVDAVIVPSDNTIAGSMGVLVKNADAVNKPVFPSADTMVKDGGVASISLSQYGQGKAAGKITARILKGEKPGQMAVNNYHHGEPVLNLKQARKLGIKVPADFQREAEQHGTVFK